METAETSIMNCRDSVVVIHEDATEAFVGLERSAQKALLFFARRADAKGVVLMTRRIAARKLDMHMITLQHVCKRLIEQGFIEQLGWGILRVNRAWVTRATRLRTTTVLLDADWRDRSLADEYSVTLRKRGRKKRGNVSEEQRQNED